MNGPQTYRRLRRAGARWLVLAIGIAASGPAAPTIGFYAYRGTAVDNAREIYEVSPAEPSQLEYRLARAGYRLAYFDLSFQGNWTATEQTLRYNGRYDQRMVPRLQYDGLVLIVDVSPPIFLY